MSLTYEILSKLLGDDYFTEPEVPILDEHILTDRAGNNEMMVDAAFLAEVAANCNARVEQTGDPCPLIVGHTDDGPRKEEKKVVGYATNFRMQPFFDSGRQALFADFHFRKENQSLPQDYPRRSVELWPKKREIDPISLLGGTTPERDLGILRFARHGESISIPYQRECIKMADEKKTDEVKDAEKGETSGMRSIENKLDQLLQLLGGLMEEAGQPPAEEPEPKGKKGDEKKGKEGKEKPPEDDDLLGPADEQEMQGPQPKENEAAEYHDTPVKFGETYLPRVTKMSRENDEVIKLQRRVQDLEKKEKETQLKYARLEAEKVVNDLETKDGIVFATKDATIEMIARLSGEAKTHYIENEIKKNYARDLTRVEDLTRFSRESVGDGQPKTMKDIQDEIAASYSPHGKK